MGEIAEILIDGTLCHTCGTYIDKFEPYYLHGHVEQSSGEYIFDQPRNCKDCGSFGITGKEEE